MRPHRERDFYKESETGW